MLDARLRACGNIRQASYVERSVCDFRDRRAAVTWQAGSLPYARTGTPLSHCDEKTRGEGRKIKTGGLRVRRRAGRLFWRRPKKSPVLTEGGRCHGSWRISCAMRKSNGPWSFERWLCRAGMRETNWRRSFLGRAPKKSPFFSAPKKPKKSLLSGRTQPA